MRLTFLLPVSATAAYISRIEWLRLSLDALGAPYDEARIGLAISRDLEGCVESRALSFEEIRAHPERYFVAGVDSERFEKINYLETGSYRYRMLDDSDVTVFCDADMLFVRPFDELIAEVLNSESMAGVIARGTPFNQGTHLEERCLSRLSNDEWWHRIFGRLLGTPAPLEYHYLTQPEVSAPFYCNAGFLIAATPVWKRMADFAYRSIETICAETGASGYAGSTLALQYSFQIAHCLAVYKEGIARRELSPAFNAWNGAGFADLTGVASEDIRVIHYYGDRLMNFYKRMNFPEMIARAEKELCTDPVSSLLYQRVSSLMGRA